MTLQQARVKTTRRTRAIGIAIVMTRRLRALAAAGWQYLAAAGWRYLAAVTSGLLLALAMPGFDQSYLAWFCLAPILCALESPGLSRRAALCLGWITGIAASLVLFSFLLETLMRFAQLSRAWAGVGVGLFAVLQGAMLAAWALAIRIVAQRRGGRTPLLAAPILLVVAEWLFPSIFPVYLAYALYGATALTQSLDLGGPLLLSFLLALASSVASRVILSLRRREAMPWRAMAALVILIAADSGYGAIRSRVIDGLVASAPRRLRVGLVQTSQGVFDGSAEVEAGVAQHRLQSLEVLRAGAELVVWGESAYNFPVTAAMKDLSASVRGPVDRPILFGGLRLELRAEGRREYHTAFLLDALGRVTSFYDKQKLVLGGEYMPLGETFSFLRQLSPYASRFTPGATASPLELEGGIRLATSICYEDLFPTVSRALVQQEAHLLVNLTNDVWFGDTREPTLHFAAASFRAVEQRRFLVRATNTGISGIVDPVGRVVAATRPFTRANLVGEVALLDGRTLYGSLGDWVGVVGLLLLAAWVLPRPAFLRRQAKV